ncbi:hypothetical protein FA15DRAFT_673622 [Coprinopsis marcescibilis]|uniref:Uncharacterized protein n=1 Tax=Coprinopsis marcescibilis TaxID=230819 RepID=A0A5C3KJ53_COPMA|nr:hypothetical protein FA15DRAFT_673622 [Coprinopsis marcescibilis]
MSAPSIAERADIHKSCKSLESLLNTLNEYCEAVNSVASLQKKLAKALKEAAALKVTGEVATHTFSASATIFETLAEVDTRYNKVVDKEYDGISVEVKKWFKKLVKEEKAHDERMESANAKIMQAGQSYEKKSKKKGVDASEEHARYINLINTLGPEISQEKYNHALNATQGHAATTADVAASLGRIADAEWLKAWECVRKFSPTIGRLGQWRALCEGGWTQPIPQGLPGPPESPNNAEMREPGQAAPLQGSPLPQNKGLDVPETKGNGPARTPPSRSPIVQKHDLPSTTQEQPSPERSPQIPFATPTDKASQTQPTTPSGRSPHIPPSTPTTQASPPKPTPPSAFDTLKQPFFDPVTGSVRTLSAFPAPPTHFPIPPPRQFTQPSTASHSAQSSLGTLTTPQLTESPTSSTHDYWGPRETSRDGRASVSQSKPAFPTQPPSPEQRYQPPAPDTTQGAEPPLEIRRPLAIRAQSSITSSGESSGPIPGQWNEHTRKPDDGREFGIARTLSPSAKERSYDGLRRGVERTDTGASIVAAMRTRYSANPGSTSPPPRELPRIPLSVPDIASKYQSNDGQISPRARASSPPVSRQLSLPLDTIRPKQEPSGQYYPPERKVHRQGQHSVSPSTPALEDDARRQKRNEEMSEQQLREKQRDLMEREREIEARARELERDRARLATMRDGVGPSNGGKMSTVDEEPPTNNSPRPPISPLRPRRVSLRQQLQRPLSQMELEDGESHNPVRARNISPIQPRYHESQAPVHQQSPTRSKNREDYRDLGNGEEEQSPRTKSPHAPYCGCDSCSVSKYRTSSTSTTETTSPQDNGNISGNLLRPPISSDKPKSSWMRRLSMPGGLSSAFHLDAKRNSTGGSNFTLGSGVSSANVGSKGLLSLDGKKNSSATNLLRAPDLDRVHEDGRLAGGNQGARRSYEANRSMTNLGLNSRR